MGLGIAKAGIELQDLGAVLGEHEAAVEAAGVGDALGGELGHHALLDIDHLGKLVGRDHGHGAVDAHAARVGAEVPVQRALVILGGGQRHQRLAVGQGQQRALRPLHHLLDHDGGARLAKRAREALVDALERFLGGLGDNDALASSQAVGLDHDGSADLAHVGRARLLVGEAAVGGGGHAGTLHDLLGKLLGALHLGGLAVGAKRRDASGAHRVGDARNQRGLRANDHKANVMPRSPGGNALGRLRVKVCHLGGGVHAAVAGSDPHLAGARGLRQLGQKRVLAPTGTQKKNVNLAVAH